MPKQRTVWWSKHENCWLSTVGGEISEKSKRPKPRRNREIGPPTGPNKLANERASLEWLQSLIEEEEQSERLASEPTLAKLFHDYLEWHVGKLASRTLGVYRQRLMVFAKTMNGESPLGDTLINDLRPQDMFCFLNACKARGLEPLYVNSIRITIDACMNWAARTVEGRDPIQILKANPFAKIARDRNPEPEKRYAGKGAHEAFFKYSVTRACIRHELNTPGWRFDRLTIALFRFCQSTGCRPSEACRLEWSHIDWEAPEARMSGKSTGKTGRKRTIPIPSKTRRMLEIIRALPGRHPRFVFTHAPGPRGGERHKADVWAGIPWNVNALDHKFKKWRDEAIELGFPIKDKGESALTLYAMRRDLGADILRNGGSHADSAEVLGHSAAINARHYASFDRKHARNLVEQVDRIRRADGSGGK